MSEQGSSTLSANEDGRLVERLAGLEKVITPAQIKQALLATERINPRACKLTHEVMLWVVLAMGLLTNMPIRQVFKHSRRMRPGEEKAPCRSSLCEARQRLGVEPVQHLFGQVVRPLATKETPGAFYHAWRLVGMTARSWMRRTVPPTPRPFTAPTAHAVRAPFRKCARSVWSR